MARLTKKQLKGILKECLKEILEEEGILLSEASAAPASRRPAAATAPDMLTQAPPAPQEEGITNPRLLEHVNSLAGTLSSNNKSESNLYRNIFADTAATTLQKQQSAGHSVGGEGSSSSISATDLLSEVSVPTPVTSDDRREIQELSLDGDVGRWAKVAFASKPGN